MTQAQFKKILKSSDDKAKRELMLSIRQRKFDWNSGKIRLSKSQIKEIVDFQLALNSLLPSSDLEKEYLGRK